MEAYPVASKGDREGETNHSATASSSFSHAKSNPTHGITRSRREAAMALNMTAPSPSTSIINIENDGEDALAQEELVVSLLGADRGLDPNRRRTIHEFLFDSSRRPSIPGQDGDYYEHNPSNIPFDYRNTCRLVRRLGDYVAYLTLLSMLIIIPIVMYRAIRKQKFDLAAFHSAEIMTFGTVILSARLVYLHLTHWYMPQVQKYVVRILWMVPIYSVQSYLSLRFHESRTYIDCIRDLYEAYVIASFVYYLIQLLGGEDALIRILLQKSDADLGKHPWPLNQIFYPWEPGEEFMLQCKHGVLQYVVFKSASTILTFFFESMGIYHEGKFDWKVAYPYLCFFQNISVAYAIYCLVRLYHAIKDELEYPVNWHPLGKFLCIKGVIFFTWWQGLIIFYLRAHGFIEGMGNWSSAEVAYGLIDYCIVIEMVGFAIAHSYTFTYQEYLPENIPHATEENLDPPGMERSTTSSTWDQLGYRPPTTLTSPMDFKDAFWSSAMPEDMREDIQRLRHEAMTAVRTRNPVTVNMSEMITAVIHTATGDDDDGETPEDGAEGDANLTSGSVEERVDAEAESA
jgi:hypothetical protein